MIRIAFLVAWAVLVQPRPDGPITVSAAVSLTNSLEAIATAYSAAGGGPVRFNFAGSNVLARQIANGAPADIFISADEAQMDFTVAAGAVDSGTRVLLLGNRLAVIVRSDRAPDRAVRTVRDLLRPDVQRIALGDPSAVPAGVYARVYLEKTGVWKDVEKKVVPVANVRAALAVVENGSADVAIVYETDSAQSTAAATSFVVAGPDAPRIVYPAAIVASSRQRAAARRFLEFLQGREASAIFGMR